MASNPEPTFAVSAFNTPLELEGADAWTTQICQLLFLEKGTYEHTPDMGIEISSKTYTDTDSYVYTMQREINTQVNQFLSNIPLNSINVSTYYWASRNTDIVRITLGFNVDGTIISRSAYVTKKDDVLTYIISKFNESTN